MNNVALTILVPAYNEAERLALTVGEIVAAAEVELNDYEVIIIDDGSKDGTAEVADRLAGQYSKVTVIHQPTNLGVGAAYSTGLAKARFPWINLVPGDHAFEADGVRNMFRMAGKADMVISYRANPHARHPVRRVLSIICTFMLRLATGCPIRDGHSMYVWPVAQARSIKVPPDYRYHLVSLCALLLDARTYIEIPVMLTPKPDASSGVMRFGVVFSLGFEMLKMLLRHYLTPRQHKARPVKSELPIA